ncbi:MAG: glutamate-5-semialdehyde dehydrogenase [Chitinophagales bacterium]
MNKNTVLKELADLLIQHKEDILLANQQDMQQAEGIDDTLRDRLKVDEKKVMSMVSAVRNVMEMPDPEGKILYEYTHPNGMLVQNRIVPFGNILIIYESRPDVTIEAAVSAFKAGNTIYLKGGKEAKNTNKCLVSLWHKALENNQFEASKVKYLDMNRTDAQKMIRENTHRFDLIIPRGGERLIRFIKTNTQVPVLVSGRGNNFMYVHNDADFEMATNLILNGKQRLSVCNALDKVFFNKNIPQLHEKLSLLLQQIKNESIEVFGTDELSNTYTTVKKIEGESLFFEEFLAAKILFSTCENMSEAIEKINRYSGGHTAVIVCKDQKIAETFQQKVDCAVVSHNASSRFTDGGEFGFGAEIAISTQKMHFRGPVGMAQLVSNKWFVYGNGQTR